jgi:putative ABC transport system permease protein
MARLSVAAMEIKEIILQGWRSILLHRLRTLLSTLGILFGVVAVIAMLAIGEGAKQETLAQIEQLGIRNVIIRQHALSDEQQHKALLQGSHLLSFEDAQALELAVPHLANFSAVKGVKSSLLATFKELSPEILAVTSGFAEIQGLELAEGRFVTALDSRMKLQVCTIGNGVARQLGPAGHLNSTLRLGHAQFKIVGILSHRSWKPGKTTVLQARNLNQTIFIPLGTELGLARSTTARIEPLTEIILQVDQGRDIAAIVPVVKRIMEVRHRGADDYQVIVPQELIEQARRTQNTFNLVLGSVAAISLLVGGIGIMNIMLASVAERVREIGIRRAVGANRWHIARQFLLESVLITLIGAIGGVILGVGCSVLISMAAGWQVIVTLWSVMVALGMAIGVGLCSGFYPAWKAASLNPIAALRNE